MDSDAPVVSRIGAVTPDDVVKELDEKLIDFHKAIDPQGLSLDEFEDYGPANSFRDMFLKGYDVFLKEVTKRRE